MGKWRGIPARDVEWRIGTDRGRPTARNLYRLCSDRHSGEWADLTLGQLADMGEINWLRTPTIGPHTVEVIKSVIDMAAEGKCVLRNPDPQPYVPTCERAKP